MNTQLPCARTHVTALDLYTAIGDELGNVLGDEPKRESVLCLLSQWGIETGGSASMWCFNLSNIRHVDGDGRDWCVIPSCSEILTDANGVKHEVHYTASANPEKCEFRGYEDLASAVVDYVDTLQRKFPDAWAAMLTGDVDAFAMALHQDKFYTAAETGYDAAMRFWMKRLDQELPSQ